MTKASNKSKRFRAGSIKRKLSRQEREQKRFDAETERMIAMIKRNKKNESL